MKISENQKKYIPLIIPVDKPFEELSKAEVKCYNKVVTEVANKI